MDLNLPCIYDGGKLVDTTGYQNRLKGTVGHCEPALLPHYPARGVLHYRYSYLSPPPHLLQSYNVHIKVKVVQGLLGIVPENEEAGKVGFL